MKPATWIPTFVGMTELFNDINKCILQFLVFWTTVTYYSDFDDPTRFFEKNVLYNFGISGARLSIDKFCALAHGARFILPDANHVTDGISTFPFAVFGGEWENTLPLNQYPFKKERDTIVGNDVWIGMGALVMPGVCIEDGAVIAAEAVVTKDVPAYAVVAGNPAKIVRQRFDEHTVHRLEALRWWDWPLEHIESAIPHLVRGELDALIRLAEAHDLP